MPKKKTKDSIKLLKEEVLNLSVKIQQLKDYLVENRTIYDDDFNETLDSNFANKIKQKGITNDDLAHYKKGNYVNMIKASIDFSDGVIYGSEKINPEIEEYLKKSGKPILEYQSPDNYIDAYAGFYDKFLEDKEAND